MIKVKIKKSIATKGSGFVDFAGNQELFPRDKKGKITPNKVFEVESTPFIEGKIASGELILISRDSEPEEADGDDDEEEELETWR